MLCFSPADENGDTECYNPLDFVAIAPHQRDIDINSIAAALLPTPKGDAYWISGARAVCRCDLLGIGEPDVTRTKITGLSSMVSKVATSRFVNGSRKWPIPSFAPSGSVPSPTRRARC
ncbi:hypothetical protein [Sinorhizobium chiapasense]|uniref:hypothetical protein n=1 Tax=Sinorhizobium chiapasense TaxID=501572 RepID=UPI0038CD3795